MARVGIIDYDLGNLPSVTKALEKAGAVPSLHASAGELDDSLDAIVLPGVGHFGAGARNLEQRGFTPVLKEWVAAGGPLLGICVGLQLFFEASEEDPDARGLGILQGSVKRLTAPKVPHMGWNTVDRRTDDDMLGALHSGDMVYFVHSYYVDPDPSCVTGVTEYAGEAFASAVRAGCVTGVQFHPEKSADVGQAILRGWLKTIP